MPLGTRCGALLVYYPHVILTTPSLQPMKPWTNPSLLSSARSGIISYVCILCLRLVCRASVSHNLAFVSAEERGILALWYPCRHVSIGVTLLRVNTEIREIPNKSI